MPAGFAQIGVACPEHYALGLREPRPDSLSVAKGIASAQAVAAN